MNHCRSLGLSIVLMFALLAACTSSPAPNSGSNQNNIVVPPASPAIQPPVDLMATGRKLYVDNCAVCHKESGKGGKVEIEGRSINPDDLTSDKIKKMPDDRIYKYIFDGIPDEGMPAFKDKLAEAEIREVVKYIRAELQK